MALTWLLASCSAASYTSQTLPGIHADTPALPYSIVCVIHGDGDYTYHGSDGEELTADAHALENVTTLAAHNPNADVIVFHQLPKNHFLFLFPLHDGEFYYFRGGRLVAEESYWRDQGMNRFAPEAALYERFHGPVTAETAAFFLYFGHEIPEYAHPGYDRSHPEWIFTIEDLAHGLRAFTGDSTRLNLLVLSTCYNGTPHSIAALAPFTRHIVASPENLHLSYFDVRALEHLELSLREDSLSALTARFAQQAFQRLSNDVETAVTVTTYDVDRIQPFLHYAGRIYDRALATLAAAPRLVSQAYTHCDCVEKPAYSRTDMDSGVEVFYRPAQFGRAAQQRTHSGWECWREAQPVSGTGNP